MIAEREEVSKECIKKLGFAFVPSTAFDSCSKLASSPANRVGLPPVAPLFMKPALRKSCRSVARPIIPPSCGGDAGSNPAGRAISYSSTLGRMLERGFIYSEHIVKIKKSEEKKNSK